MTAWQPVILRPILLYNFLAYHCSGGELSAESDRAVHTGRGQTIPMRLIPNN